MSVFLGRMGSAHHVFGLGVPSGHERHSQIAWVYRKSIGHAGHTEVNWVYLCLRVATRGTPETIWVYTFLRARRVHPDSWFYLGYIHWGTRSTRK